MKQLINNLLSFAKNTEDEAPVLSVWWNLSDDGILSINSVQELPYGKIPIEILFSGTCKREISDTEKIEVLKNYFNGGGKIRKCGT